MNSKSKQAMFVWNKVQSINGKQKGLFLISRVLLDGCPIRWEFIAGDA